MLYILTAFEMFAWRYEWSGLKEIFTKEQHKKRESHQSIGNSNHLSHERLKQIKNVF